MSDLMITCSVDSTMQNKNNIYFLAKFKLKSCAGRNSADRQYNNNDSLSSSGVYSEEERKLNLKAR